MPFFPIFLRSYNFCHSGESRISATTSSFTRYSSALSGSLRQSHSWLFLSPASSPPLEPSDLAVELAIELENLFLRLPQRLLTDGTVPRGSGRHQSVLPTPIATPVEQLHSRMRHHDTQGIFSSLSTFLSPLVDSDCRLGRLKQIVRERRSLSRSMVSEIIPRLVNPWVARDDARDLRQLLADQRSNHREEPAGHWLLSARLHRPGRTRESASTESPPCHQPRPADSR